MPIQTYEEDALTLINFGLDCVGLDLSSGDNRFDIHRLNHPSETDVERCGQESNANLNDFCLTQLPKALRDQVRKILCPIPIPIDEFKVPGGKVRLNHLEKKMAAFSWSELHGGSILLTINFASTGKELLGTYHGEINNAKLSVYMPVIVDGSGELSCGEVAIRFSARINIIGISNYLEGKLRRTITHAVAKAAGEAFEPQMASELVRAVVGALTNAPPPDAFFIEASVVAHSATLSWAGFVQEARLVITSLNPLMAPAAKWLRLDVKLGRSGTPLPTVTFDAQPGTSFVLPINNPNLSVMVPNSDCLELQIVMRSFTTPFTLPPIVEVLGEISASFPSPGLGVGSHSATDGQLTAGYEILVT